jgi:hypothetical protein
MAQYSGLFGLPKGALRRLLLNSACPGLLSGSFPARPWRDSGKAIGTAMRTFAFFPPARTQLRSWGRRPDQLPFFSLQILPKSEFGSRKLTSASRPSASRCGPLFADDLFADASQTTRACLRHCLGPFGPADRTDPLSVRLFAHDCPLLDHVLQVQCAEAAPQPGPEFFHRVQVRGELRDAPESHSRRSVRSAAFSRP